MGSLGCKRIVMKSSSLSHVCNCCVIGEANWRLSKGQEQLDLQLLPLHKKVPRPYEDCAVRGSVCHSQPMIPGRMGSNEEESLSLQLYSFYWTSDICMDCGVVCVCRTGCGKFASLQESSASYSICFCLSRLYRGCQSKAHTLCFLDLDVRVAKTSYHFGCLSD